MYGDSEPGAATALVAPRVLIVAEHASAKFGGEAVLPLHYFRVLRARGVETFLVVHERTREELDALFPNDRARIHYVRDTRLHVRLWALQSSMPRRLGDASIGVLLRIVSQWEAREIAKALVASHAIDVVHQPMPVSPKDPSVMHGLGVPVVIGPMNGGMTYPAAFRGLESKVERRAIGVLRGASHALHHALRGKIEATTLVVANARTAEALPRHIRGRIETLVENGVDLATFGFPGPREPAPGLRAVFVGRLVDWKALDVAIEALARTPEDVTLEVVGDGPMRDAWTALAEARGLGERVRFHGFMPQRDVARLLDRCDALVLPSVYECGGAVVLEAMAKALPVVATDWGGPSDYLDETTGVLVAPTGREALIEGFASALVRLYEAPELRARMGTAARARVLNDFDWEKKVTAMIEIYRDAIARHGGRA